jgi:ATP-dependent exoDNAse (exonuclease V) beta subunit
MSAPLLISKATPQAASGYHYGEDGIRSRKTEEGKVIGTIVHEYLEVMTEEGVDAWGRERLVSESEIIKNRLGLNGIPRARLNQCGQIIHECLLNTLESKRGKWLLERYEDDACEFPVNGIVDGQLVHATIDRVIVDEGVCWVIDYKTTSPSIDQERESFLKSEAKRYHQQLQLYVNLISKVKVASEVRAALYFPRFDGWKEVNNEAF